MYSPLFFVLARLTVSSGRYHNHKSNEHVWTNDVFWLGNKGDWLNIQDGAGRREQKAQKAMSALWGVVNAALRPPAGRGNAKGTGGDGGDVASGGRSGIWGRFRSLSSRGKVTDLFRGHRM